MSYKITGNIIIDEWIVLDVNDVPLTGVTYPAGVTMTLDRQSGSTIVAASETLSWTEIGTTGRYYFSFTPTNSGIYILHLNEIHALSGGSQPTFRYDVVAAGAVFSPTYSNAFCAESDIERWIQTSIDATSRPNDTEAAAFAESRAAVLMTLCAKWGLTITPSTVTAGSRLEDLLREANAIGAALDYTVAQQFAYQPSKSDRAIMLQSRWIEYVGGAQPGFVTESIGILQKEIGNLVSLATDHILSGDTMANPAASAPATNAAIGFTMGDLF
jgi:hypothetical protein